MLLWKWERCWDPFLLQLWLDILRIMVSLEDGPQPFMSRELLLSFRLFYGHLMLHHYLKSTRDFRSVNWSISGRNFQVILRGPQEFSKRPKDLFPGNQSWHQNPFWQLSSPNFYSDGHFTLWLVLVKIVLNPLINWCVILNNRSWSFPHI